MRDTCKFCECLIYKPIAHGLGVCTPGPSPFDVSTIRKFASGATRDQDDTKHDYEGYLSPLVLERFGAYMTKHRTQADGTKRDSDNWTKGIPLSAYMKSLLRHVVEAWKAHRGFNVKESLEDSLCAVLFNAQGYLYELLKLNNVKVEQEAGLQAYIAGAKMSGTSPTRRYNSLDPDYLTPEEEKAWDDVQANGNKQDAFRTHWNY